MKSKFTMMSFFLLISISGCSSVNDGVLSKSDQSFCTKLRDSYDSILSPELSSAYQYGERLLNIKSISSNFYTEFDNKELFEITKDISNIELGADVPTNRAQFLNALTKIITVQKICLWTDQVVDPSL